MTKKKEKMDKQPAPKKTEEEKKKELIVDEFMQKKEEEEAMQDGQVPTPEEEPVVEEPVQEEPSIKQQQAMELFEKRRFDTCPQCGKHAMEGAIQPRIPFPMGDQIMVVALPMLACTGCTTVYMPRSTVNELLNPQKTEKPRIILAE